MEDENAVEDDELDVCPVAALEVDVIVLLNVATVLDVAAAVLDVAAAVEVATVLDVAAAVDVHRGILVI